MLTSYKDREFYDGMRVRVYRNLRAATWSVVAAEGPNKNKVVAHGNDFGIAPAAFSVSEAGRERARREQRRNIHAWIQGPLMLTKEPHHDLTLQQVAIYNPFCNDWFEDQSIAHGRHELYGNMYVVWIDNLVWYGVLYGKTREATLEYNRWSREAYERSGGMQSNRGERT